MAENKRYYWLKMSESFFDSKEIKFLRRVAGGDTFAIIYQRMMILSLEQGGKLFFDNIGDTFAEEIAIELDEDVKNVEMTLAYLQGKKLIEFQEIDKSYYLTQVPEMIGGETESARIKRRQRAREIDKVDNVHQLSEPVQKSPAISDKESDKDIDKESESESNQEKDFGQSSESDLEISETDQEIKNQISDSQNQELKKVCDFYQSQIGQIQKPKKKSQKTFEQKTVELLVKFDSKQICDALILAKENRARSKIDYAKVVLENQEKDNPKRVKGVPEWSRENQTEPPKPIVPEDLVKLLNMWIESNHQDEQQATLSEVKSFQKSKWDFNINSFLNWRRLSPMQRAQLESR